MYMTYTGTHILIGYNISTESAMNETLYQAGFSCIRLSQKHNFQVNFTTTHINNTDTGLQTVMFYTSKTRSKSNKASM